MSIRQSAISSNYFFDLVRLTLEESVAGSNILMHSINNIEKTIDCIMGINHFLNCIPNNCYINTYTESKYNW